MNRNRSSETNTKSSTSFVTMPLTIASSRSRSRSRSPTVTAAQQHVHPLAFAPQPQGVRLATTWVALQREIWALRVTIRILNLIIAAVWNLPVRFSATIGSRIGSSTWARDRSINRTTSCTTEHPFSVTTYIPFRNYYGYYWTSRDTCGTSETTRERHY